MHTSNCIPPSPYGALTLFPFRLRTNFYYAYILNKCVSNESDESRADRTGDEDMAIVGQQ